MVENMNLKFKELVEQTDIRLTKNRDELTKIENQEKKLQKLKKKIKSVNLYDKLLKYKVSGELNFILISGNYKLGEYVSQNVTLEIKVFKL